jgi:hypothetical protein
MRQEAKYAERRSALAIWVCAIIPPFIPSRQLSVDQRLKSMTGHAGNLPPYSLNFIRKMMFLPVLDTLIERDLPSYFPYEYRRCRASMGHQSNSDGTGSMLTLDIEDINQPLRICGGNRLLHEISQPSLRGFRQVSRNKI